MHQSLNARHQIDVAKGRAVKLEDAIPYHPQKARSERNQSATIGTKRTRDLDVDVPVHLRGQPSTLGAPIDSGYLEWCMHTLSHHSLRPSPPALFSDFTSSYSHNHDRPSVSHMLRRALRRRRYTRNGQRSRESPSVAAQGKGTSCPPVLPPVCPDGIILFPAQGTGQATRGLPEAGRVRHRETTYSSIQDSHALNWMDIHRVRPLVPPSAERREIPSSWPAACGGVRARHSKGEGREGAFEWVSCRQGS